MTGYLIRRFFQMILVVLVATFLIYGLLAFAPGGPLSGLLTRTGQEKVTREDIKRMERLMGLDKPWHLQYVTWLAGDDWMAYVPSLEEYAGNSKGVLRLDFGKSWKIAQALNVLDLVRSRLGDTLILMTLSMIVSLSIALPVGILSAVKQYSKFDYAVTAFAYFGISMPAFWFGLFLILVFCLLFKNLGLPNMPSGDIFSLHQPPPGSLLAALYVQPGGLLDRLVHLILPCLVLSLLYTAGWARYVRSSMLEVLRQDYVRTARAKGLIERIVLSKHALRNALIPIITIVTLEIPTIFGGAVITETVFNYKAMGHLYIEALDAGDWPVVMALLLITAILVVAANLLADILYTVVDPRIRYT